MTNGSGWVVHGPSERAAPKAVEDNARFDAQKQYLQNNTPYRQFEFVGTFGYPWNYSKTQATQLHPLLRSYRSNFLATAASRSGPPGWTNLALQDLRGLEFRIGEGLGVNPWELVASSPASEPPTAKRPSAPVVSPIRSNSISRTPPTRPSRYTTLPTIPGAAFHPITRSLLKDAGVSSLVVNAHRVSDNRLWLDLRYGRYPHDWHSAIAAWDPAHDTWDIIPCPATRENIQSLPAQAGGETESGLYFQSFSGALYVSQWNEPLRKFDLSTRRWETLPVPVVKPTQLFAIHGHLYGASEETIFEILDGGQSTRLLAGCRRRPAASRLDSLYSFGDVMLLPGPAKTLRASIGETVFAWDGQDWREPVALRGASRPAIFADGTIFRSGNTFWLLPHDQTKAELCFRQEQVDAGGLPAKAAARSPGASEVFSDPAWPLLLNTAAVGIFNSNLYFVSPRTISSNVIADVAFVNRNSPKALSIQIKLGEDFGSFVDGPPRPFGTRVHLRPWIDFTGGALVIGQGRWSGVWTIPQQALETAFAAEKERQRRIK